ncbi:MAG: maleylpyruvate isomerase N-terminal domain-containing protein, partial [Chloroflexi bacterium]|nr:maleylpyruvate isomerase N-terminal domain-containing protein [Chloroflexota bacterium]
MSNTEQVRAHIQLVRALSNELAAYIYTLPEDVWRDAEQFGSACEGWKVADVIAHLIGGAGMYAQSVERALRGDTSLPLGYKRPSSREEATQRLVAVREAYDEDLFYEFNASCRRLNSLLVSLEPEDYERPAWHPFSVITVSRFIEYRVLELAVHGWDVRYSMDRSATLSQRAIPFLKGWLWRWLRAGFQKGEPLEPPVRYRFVLDDPVTDSYDVVVTGDNFRL